MCDNSLLTSWISCFSLFLKLFLFRDIRYSCDVYIYPEILSHSKIWYPVKKKFTKTSNFPFVRKSKLLFFEYCILLILFLNSQFFEYCISNFIGSVCIAPQNNVNNTWNSFYCLNKRNELNLPLKFSNLSRVDKCLLFSPLI